MSAWLAQLKSGDKVIVSNGFYGDSVGIVDRVTKTQVVIGNAKYRRSSGSIVGSDSWSRGCIREATPTLIDKCMQRHLADKLAKHKWHEVPLATLAGIASMVGL